MQRFEYDLIRHCMGLFIGLLSMIGTQAAMDGEYVGACLAAVLISPCAVGFQWASRKIADLDPN